ncbi:MAG TPA: AgmX/PglI C-terminal domain-containing protein [Polyangiaceae bacterium]|nr:AgmX/PglI C-terminal domain-containing protein [Polyangiaceae bacterium]
MAHVQPEYRSFHSQPVPAFAFVSAAQPRCEIEPDAPTHVLLQQGTLAPGEFERAELETVEVLGLWGSTVLFARHLQPCESFTIGESAAAAHVDFELAAHELGESSARLIEMQNGTPHVLVPRAARLNVKRASEPYAQPSEAASVALLAGTVVELELGKLKFCIANVPAGQTTPRAGLASAEPSVLSAFGVSFTAAAALIASFAFWMPALGLSDDEGLDNERLVLMKQYLNASAVRELEEKQANADEAGSQESAPGKPAEAAAGREGAMGKLNAPVTNRRAAVRGDHPEVQLSHAQMVASAKTFGMIELLGSLSTSSDGGSPFIRDPALGHDGFDAEGNMFGLEPGESGGFGGLRLTGLDNGGGGHGVGIGIDGVGDSLGLPGSGDCKSGPCTGFGRGSGRVGGAHVSRAPSLRSPSSTVSGHLPPEVVQRIVRQNYGRFRQCYENGLRANPNLTGRVTARFVIGREGSVTNVQNGGSDLPDSGVVSCVVSAFYGLSFPTPEAGIVTVSYPIMFSPG